MRYSELLDHPDGNTYLQQQNYESETEYISVSRSIDDLLECERDAVQQMLGEMGEVSER